MVAIKGLYQKRGWWYFSRMRGGIRKTIALETREESDAIRMALELANGPDLAIGGTLEGEIEAFIAFKLARNEFSRFSAENKRLTLKRFARWVGPRTPIPSIKTSDLQRFYGEERGRVTESTAQGYMMCLRSFFTWLQKERTIIATNPATGISMGRWDYGTKAEYCQPELRDALLASVRQLRWLTVLFSECLLRFRSGNAGNRVVFIVAAGEDTDLLHDGFEESLGDLARRNPGHFGIDHGLNKLSGGHPDSSLRDDFGCRLEDAISVLIERNGNSGGLAHGIRWLSLK